MMTTTYTGRALLYTTDTERRQDGRNVTGQPCRIVERRGGYVWLDFCNGETPVLALVYDVKEPE